MKAFSERRRTVKPNRKHAASRNPVKVLQTRDDVKDEFDDDVTDEDDDEDIGDEDKGKKTVCLICFLARDSKV